MLAFYRQTFVIVAIFFLAIPVFAGEYRSALSVSCQVVKSGYVKMTDTCLSTKISTPVTIAPDLQLLKELNITCPPGTHVSIKFDLEIFNTDTKASCPLNNPGDNGFEFYKDSSCTEVWNPGEEHNTGFTKQKNSLIEQLFCRTNKKNVEPKDNDVVIMTLELKF